MASRNRVGTRNIGGKDFLMNIRLVEITTPKGTFPKVIVTYKESGIIYAEVWFKDLPEDIRRLFVKEGEL